jgi:hypothetical protein
MLRTIVYSAHCKAFSTHEYVWYLRARDAQGPGWFADKAQAKADALSARCRLRFSTFRIGHLTIPRPEDLRVYEHACSPFIYDAQAEGVKKRREVEREKRKQRNAARKQQENDALSETEPMPTTVVRDDSRVVEEEVEDEEYEEEKEEGEEDKDDKRRVPHEFSSGSSNHDDD